MNSLFNWGYYFIELLKCYAKRCKDVGDTLKIAPKNNQMTISYIQKDIITTCKMKKIKWIIEDLNGDYFSLLVDESHNVLCKEQMTIVLCYVNRRESVMQRFISIIRVCNTVALSLKNKIIGLHAQYSLNNLYMWTVLWCSK